MPWHVLAAWHSSTLFGFYVLDNHLLRFLNARRFVEDDVPISTLGFPVASFLCAFPWGVFALARPTPNPSRAARWRPVMVAWVLVIVGLFALSRFKHEYYALPAFSALAILWVGAGLTPVQAMNGLAGLNIYYRILREQGVPFPFASPRPFGLLLQELGLTLLVGWGVATICWMRGWRRGAFVSLLVVAVAITTLILQLLDVVEPHHSAKAISQAITAQAAPNDTIVLEGSSEYSPALPFYTGRRVFLMVRRPAGQSVVAALPPGSVHEVGRYGSRWLYSNR